MRANLVIFTLSLMVSYICSKIFTTTASITTGLPEAWPSMQFFKLSPSATPQQCTILIGQQLTHYLNII